MKEILLILFGMAAYTTTSGKLFPFGQKLKQDNGSYHIQKILSAEYDKLEFRSYHEPVTLHKNKEQQVCVAVFDSQSFGGTLKLIISPPFKVVDEQHKYFLHYETKEGKKGWYDTQKGICITDKW